LNFGTAYAGVGNKGSGAARAAVRQVEIGADMSDTAYHNDAQFEVVLNDEEQYSIWPVGKAVPAGWRKAGKQASKEACLEFIKQEWTDMRPLSLRTKMDASVQ
jgi:MbtH protein